MGKVKGTVNTKVEAGKAKKAVASAQKQAVSDAQLAAEEAAAWNQGANLKRADKDDEAARKADEAARKRREKAELLAAEEDALGSGGTTQGKKALVAAKKNKGKKKNDEFALLDDELQTSADKKMKKTREEEQKRKAEAEAAARRREEARAAQAAAMDPLLANTNAMIGDAINELYNDEEGAAVGRNANKVRMEAAGTSGIDAALDSLQVSSNKGATPAKSAKALYAEFEDRMMPVVREEHPGLRLSQYKEKIFALWKKSPENPANLPKSS
jgi:Coiled-coil domain-containing protein 124 /Oxs1